MANTALTWTVYTEAVVGRNHPTLTDTDNRALRLLLANSGFTPDNPNYGLAVGTKTYNAASFPGATKEAQITAAIAQAVTDSIPYVFVPATMLPYNASLVTFNSAVKMIGEGTDPGAWEQRSYGYGLGGASDTAALAAVALANLSNVKLGVASLLNPGGPGNQNVAIGDLALGATTTGSANVAVGYNTLPANTTGSTNTAVGVTAMISNISGSDNTAIGVDALFTNTTGSNNTAVGSNALGFGSGGGSNTAIGWRALFNGGAGSNNTAVGLQSSTTKTSGNFNTSIGTGSLQNNTTGGQNTALGTYTLLNNVTGVSNVAVGYLAGAYELGSNAFYVNNRDQLSTASDKANSLLYGTFGAAAANQTLSINAALTLNAGTFVQNFGAASGSFQQMAIGTADVGTPMQLLIGNNTSVSMDIDAVLQGTGFKLIRLARQAGGAVSIGTDPGGTDILRVNGALTINVASPMIRTKTSFTNNAAAQTATLTNGPTAGNPTKWIPIDDNGTTRNIPAW